MLTNTSSLRNVILLNDLSLVMSIGLHDFEREKPQRVLVSMEIEYQPGDVRQDRLDQVVDYDVVRDTIRSLAAKKHYDTQEAFAYAILDHLEEMTAITKMSITTKKPDVFPDCNYVGFNVTWTR